MMALSQSQEKVNHQPEIPQTISILPLSNAVAFPFRIVPLSVGRIKTKVLAAHRAGLKAVILPKKNESDIDDLPDDVRNTLNFVATDRIGEVLDVDMEALYDPNNYRPNIKQICKKPMFLY